jgi:hypothetical protein
MTCTPLKLAAEAGLRLADPKRPELGWRSFAFDRIREDQRKKQMTPRAEPGHFQPPPLKEAA